MDSTTDTSTSVDTNDTYNAPENDEFAYVPAELKARPQWVVWKFEDRGDVNKDGNPKPTKVPYTTANNKASSNNPDTWTTFERALNHYRRSSRYDGIGFVFSEDDPYCGIDLDNCILRSGTIQPWAQEIINAVASYAEISPSGTGVKIICRATGAGSGRKLTNFYGGAIEMYDYGRFFTITGWAV